MTRWDQQSVSCRPNHLASVRTAVPELPVVVVARGFLEALQLRWEGSWAVGCTAALDQAVQHPSSQSSAASVVAGTDRPGGRPRSPDCRRVHMAVAVLAVRRTGVPLAGHIRDAARPCRSSRLAQRHLARWAATKDTGRIVVSEGGDCNLQYCAGYTPWIAVPRACGRNTARPSKASRASREGRLIRG